MAIDTDGEGGFIIPQNITNALPRTISVEIEPNKKIFLRTRINDEKLEHEVEISRKAIDSLIRELRKHSTMTAHQWVMEELARMGVGMVPGKTIVLECVATVHARTIENEIQRAGTVKHD